MNRSGIPSIVHSVFAAATILCVVTMPRPAIGQVIFQDRFDTETVGSFPSTWTNAASGPNAQIYVTNNIPGTPSSPNVFQFANNNTNESFTSIRQFPTYSLNTVSNLVINYKLNIATLPGGGSLGFVIVPAFLPSQGEETFATPRFVSNASGKFD